MLWICISMYIFASYWFEHLLAWPLTRRFHKKRCEEEKKNEITCRRYNSKFLFINSSFSTFVSFKRILKVKMKSTIYHPFIISGCTRCEHSWQLITSMQKQCVCVALRISSFDGNGWENEWEKGISIDRRTDERMHESKFGFYTWLFVSRHQ